MEKELDENIKFKIAIGLRTLLQRNKDLNISNKQINRMKYLESYGSIATQSLLRKATITSVFNAHAAPSSNTLIKIIEAMGYTLGEFSKVYDSISESEIDVFKKRTAKK